MKPIISIVATLFFYCLTVAIPAAHGKQLTEITANNTDYILNQGTLLYKKQHATISDILEVIKASDSAFIRNNIYQEINYGFYKPSGWCKFSIKNTGDYNDWILKIQQSRVDTVQLFMLRENDILEKFPLTGHFQNIMERPYYSLHFAFPVNIKKGETVTFFLYTQRQFGRHATIISLEKLSYFKNYEHLFSNFISVIEGMILLAMLVGFVLYFFISDKIYLYYSIYCLSFFVLVLADSGFLHAFISNEKYQFVINTFTTIFYYWIVGWHMLLTIILINLKAYQHNWAYMVGRVSGFLFCFIALLLFFVPIPDVLRWWLGYFSYFIVFFMDAYILYVIFIGIVRKEPGVYFYLTGFLVTLFVASLLMIADLQLVDGINQNTDLYYFTPLLEIIFMVLGLGIHFSANMKEKFRAQIDLNKTQHQMLTIQEDERRRIARDLHDDVGNSLAAIKNMLVQKRDNQLIEQEVNHIINDIRNISHNLMPVDFQEHHLSYIIEHTVNKFKNHPSISFEYEHAGDIIKIDPVKELVIYRIINELITNILKHSNATSALIQLIYQEEGLIVMVEDNGTGIHTSNKQDGLGLKNIRLRAEYISAKLNFESDHKGTLAILEIPYDHNS